MHRQCRICGIEVANEAYLATPYLCRWCEVYGQEVQFEKTMNALI